VSVEAKRKRSPLSVAVAFLSALAKTGAQEEQQAKNASCGLLLRSYSRYIEFSFVCPVLQFPAYRIRGTDLADGDGLVELEQHREENCLTIGRSRAGPRIAFAVHEHLLFLTSTDNVGLGSGEMGDSYHRSQLLTRRICTRALGDHWLEVFWLGWAIAKIVASTKAVFQTAALSGLTVFNTVGIKLG